MEWVRTKAKNCLTRDAKHNKKWPNVTLKLRDLKRNNLSLKDVHLNLLLIQKLTIQLT
jgi:hypothetical protein